MEGEGGTIHLDAEAVLLVHAQIFRLSIDAARDRVLKPEGLESAVSRPPTYEHCQGADLALQAAVLAHGIAEGQIFVDGNKRTSHVRTRNRLWRWSEVAAWAGVVDPSVLEEARVIAALNAALELRSTARELPADVHSLIASLKR